MHHEVAGAVICPDCFRVVASEPDGPSFLAVEAHRQRGDCAVPVRLAIDVGANPTSADAAV